jgi:UDP-N-acetylmuramoyl-tripeptide--D-alanyl-D-alanine ligase
MSPKQIVDAIAEYQPSNNRSQLIHTGKNTVIMDAYNANPSSMSAAINEFLRIDGLNKMLILGEMREVGDSSLQEHENLIESLKKQGVRNVICMGEAFKHAAREAGFSYVENIDNLLNMLRTDPVQGNIVFVKGSRSNRLEKIIPLL